MYVIVNEVQKYQTAANMNSLNSVQGKKNQPEKVNDDNQQWLM